MQIGEGYLQEYLIALGKQINHVQKKKEEAGEKMGGGRLFWGCRKSAASRGPSCCTHQRNGSSWGSRNTPSHEDSMARPLREHPVKGSGRDKPQSSTQEGGRGAARGWTCPEGGVGGPELCVRGTAPLWGAQPPTVPWPRGLLLPSLCKALPSCLPHSSGVREKAGLLHRSLPGSLRTPAWG